MVAAIAEAVIGPNPGMLISRRAVSSFCAIFAIVGSSRTNAFIQTMKLMNEFRQRLAHFKRDSLVAGLDQIGQFAGVSGPLRGDDADLGQVAAQPIEQLRALRDQHLPRLVTHQRRLVLQRAQAHKPH